MASGTGTNFGKLLAADIAPGKIVAFATDKPGCGAESIARNAGLSVHAEAISRGAKADFEDRVIAHFLSVGVEVIALCGYMRILSPRLIEAFPRGILNVHPSLLPAFPGVRGPKQALDYGVRIAGCTIHLVDAGMDTGPILEQRAVPVFPGDDESILAARILFHEHLIYAPTLARWCRGEYQRDGRRMISLNPL
jgi:phosphoribosylglycinamide formyltransferase-1